MKSFPFELNGGEGGGRDGVISLKLTSEKPPCYSQVEKTCMEGNESNLNM